MLQETKAANHDEKHKEVRDTNSYISKPSYTSKLDGSLPNQYAVMNYCYSVKGIDTVLTLSEITTMKY